MNAGQACLSCHATASGERPKFTLAGSLYKTSTGGGALSGATITITDSNNVQTSIVTGNDGAFYSSQTFAFPVFVQASRCPDTQIMPSKPTTGDCNSCHDSSMRIHLP